MKLRQAKKIMGWSKGDGDYYSIHRSKDHRDSFWRKMQKLRPAYINENGVYVQPSCHDIDIIRRANTRLRRWFKKKKIIMEVLKSKTFKNGSVYCLKLSDGMLVETTDTFLPYYTKDAIGRKQNKLDNAKLGNRSERWMIGVSTMSGCPVRCKFCATGNMKKYRNLTADEIVAQVEFAISQSGCNPFDAKEFKINYTRMGEPFLNIEAVKEAIRRITDKYPHTHHYVSTIGIKDSDFSFVKGNVTLQISLHSFDDEKRNWLIPYPKKMTIEELGQIRTESNLKTTINLTLVDESDFDAEKLQKYFDKDYFFVKLSPINPNSISEKNHLGNGIIEGVNLV